MDNLSIKNSESEYIGMKKQCASSYTSSNYFGEGLPSSLKCKKGCVLRSQNIFSYLTLHYYKDLNH